MTPFFAELVGTALLLYLGDGVVANVVLQKTKGHNSGWIVITFGWALAVFIGVFVASSGSYAHINPAVTLAMAVKGTMSWSEVPTYLIAQFLGAAVGAFLVWLQYSQHFDATEEKADKLAVFATAPAIRNTVSNLISEALGTMVLVLAVFFITGPTFGDVEASLGSLDALPVAFVVFAIGMSLGGTTGYAINPARDLSPRIMHAILPIKGKGANDWSYSWIPVVGPFIGGLLAVLIFNLITNS